MQQLRKSRVIIVITLILLAVWINFFIQPFDKDQGDNNDSFDKEEDTTLQYPFNITNTIAQSNDEYNLFVLQEFKRGKKEFSVLFTDLRGKIVKDIALKSSFNDLSEFNAEFYNASTLLLSDDDGILLYNFVTNNARRIPLKGHHDYTYNPILKTFFTLQEVDLGSTAFIDKIVEVDIKGNKIWEFNTLDIVTDLPKEAFWLTDSQGRIDMTHANSLYYDVVEDVLYLNLRNLNTFYKINRTTSEIIWAIGEYGTFIQYNNNGYVTPSIFNLPHAVKPIGDNKFIMFDNDYNTSEFMEPRSRLVEFQVNEIEQTVKETWVWVASRSYYTPFWGDASKLPNGNRIGVFGVVDHPNTNIGARVVEINPLGEIIWEMNLPNNLRDLYGIYRLDRFRFIPYVEVLNSPNNVLFQADDIKSISWLIWYNYYNLQSIRSKYQILIDEILVEEKLLIFKQFWEETQLSYFFPDMPPNTYALELRVFDDAGKFASSYLTITIESSNQNSLAFINWEDVPFLHPIKSWMLTNYQDQIGMAVF